MTNVQSSDVFFKFIAAQIARTTAVLFLALSLFLSATQAYAGGTRTSNPEDFQDAFGTRTSQGAVFTLLLCREGKTVHGRFFHKNSLYSGTIRGDLQTQPDGTLALLYVTDQPGLKGNDRYGSGVMQIYTDHSFKADHVFSTGGVKGRIDWTGRSSAGLYEIYTPGIC